MPLKREVRNVECGMNEAGAQARNAPRSALRAPHFFGSQGVISSARRFAKAEVRGASPRESAISIYDFRFSIANFCDCRARQAIVNPES